jgi:hypothetical protein
MSIARQAPKTGVLEGEVSIGRRGVESRSDQLHIGNVDANPVDYPVLVHLSWMDRRRPGAQSPIGRGCL